MGRVARWLLALAEYELSCVAPRAIKSQARTSSRSFQVESASQISPEMILPLVDDNSEEWVLSLEPPLGTMVGQASC